MKSTTRSMTSGSSGSRRTSHQVNVSCGMENEGKEESNKRHTLAFKEATEAWANRLMFGIGPGTRQIVDECNKRNNCVHRLVSRSTVERHVKEGKVQVSPELKRGPKSRIPPMLLDLTASYANIGQLLEG